jgi:hypothetical protein
MPYNTGTQPAKGSLTQQNAGRDATSNTRNVDHSMRNSNNTTNSHNTTHDRSTTNNTNFHDSAKQNNFQGMSNSGTGNTQTFG